MRSPTVQRGIEHAIEHDIEHAIEHAVELATASIPFKNLHGLG